MGIFLPAPSQASLADLFSKASEHCAKYEWQAAAELYEQASNLAGKNNTQESARIAELLSDAYFKGAFQAADREEFKRRMLLAQDSYIRTSTLMGKAGSEALSKKAEARALFASYWRADIPEERGEIIQKCTKLAEENARSLEDQDEIRQLAEAHRDSLTYLMESTFYIDNWEGLHEQFEKIERIAERAADESQLLHGDQTLVEVLFLTAWLLSIIAFKALEPAQYLPLFERKKKLAVQIGALAEKIGTPYAYSLAHEARGWIATVGQLELEDALTSFEAAASITGTIKDSLLAGRIYTGLLQTANWKAINQDDIDVKRRLLEQGLEVAPKAISYLQISLAAPLLSQTYAWYAECYNDIARRIATSIDDREKNFREAIRIATTGRMYQPTWDVNPTHPLSKAMYFLAGLTSEPKPKAQLLHDALRTREEQIKAEERCYPPGSWDQGVSLNYLALIKAELASLEHAPMTRTQLLNSAILDMQRCIEYCTPYATTPGTSGGLANYEEWYGDILLKLNSLTREPEPARKAIKIYQSAILHFEKAKQAGSIAAARWKIAKSYDSIGEHENAAETFQQAAADYLEAGKKIPGLTPIFEELAAYMKTWSAVNRARLQHNAEHYSQAAEEYRSAAKTLEATKTWGHLSKHYEACALLEDAETKSREEEQNESIQLFSDAAQRFRENNSQLEDRIKNRPSTEAEELRTWQSISVGREKLALGRLQLEEARLLDKKGERSASAAKYHTAAETFKALLTEIQDERDPSELRTLALSCDAWAKMKEAEAKASPALYREAGELFLESKEATGREKLRLSALANASICKALESGTRFRLTQNVELYSEIKKQLVAAAGYYEEAGFQNAADWTHATQRLFDALVYLADAEVKKNPKSKAELYHLVEKHLELAAELYGKAGYSSKREEALRYLKKARIERELLLTPMEALAENPATLSTPVASPTLIRDQAIGLERFESANVQGSLIAREREVNVGSSLSVELEIANIGKTAAMLIKLENIIPEGFTLDKERSQLTDENGYINMKGRRLDYLKTFEAKIGLKALRKGEHTLKPRILFADEKGSFRSFDFEPVAIIVRELGISGWVRGASK